jgi:hypothetical protein
MRKGLDVHAPGVPQRAYEEVGHNRLAPDPDASVPEIHLNLLARRRLEADRRDRWLGRPPGVDSLPIEDISGRHYRGHLHGRQAGQYRLHHVSIDHRLALHQAEYATAPPHVVHHPSEDGDGEFQMLAKWGI